MSAYLWSIKVADLLENVLFIENKICDWAYFIYSLTRLVFIKTFKFLHPSNLCGSCSRERIITQSSFGSPGIYYLFNYMIVLYSQVLYSETHQLFTCSFLPKRTLIRLCSSFSLMYF